MLRKVSKSIFILIIKNNGINLSKQEMALIYSRKTDDISSLSWGDYLNYYKVKVYSATCESKNFSIGSKAGKCRCAD